MEESLVRRCKLKHWTAFLLVFLSLSLLFLSVSSLLDQGPLRNKLVKPGGGLSHESGKVVVRVIICIITKKGIQDESLQRSARAEISCKALSKEISNESPGRHWEAGLLEVLQQVAMDIASKGNGLLLGEFAGGANTDEEVPEAHLSDSEIRRADAGSGGCWPELDGFLSQGNWGLQPVWQGGELVLIGHVWRPKEKDEIPEFGVQRI